MGRRRKKDLQLLPGVRLIGESLFWQPTSKQERAERKAKGLKASAPLGPAVRVRGRVELTKAQRATWLELSGYRDREDQEGTVAELVHLWEREGIKAQPNGEPRADSTVELYKGAIPFVVEKLGGCRYGKTSIEASRGQAIGPADIQRFVSKHPFKAMANRYFAILDNSFAFGISEGCTVYNPCEDVVKNASRAREREPLPWEVECLRTLANQRYGLLMDFEAITGWRVDVEILAMQRSQITPDGVRVRKAKKGKREIWEWTPELRRIITEAATLPGATPFGASPVFPSRRGRKMAYSTFNGGWQALKRRTNAWLADGVLDPDSLELAAGLAIADLHFHDLRSKAHDDAEEAGIPGHDFLGNTAGVARKHYRRREQRRRPLR